MKVGSEGEISSSGGAEGVKMALSRALKFYSTIQADDGHWPGDYGGPLFLLPGLVNPWLAFPLIIKDLKAINLLIHNFV